MQAGFGPAGHVTLIPALTRARLPNGPELPPSPRPAPAPVPPAPDQKVTLTVRRHFDLLLALSLFALLAALPLLPAAAPLRALLGFWALLLVPGHFVTELLFPRLTGRAGGLAPVERLALSAGLSIVSITLCGLLLSATPWGVRAGPMLLALATLCGLAHLLGLWVWRGRPHAGPLLAAPTRPGLVTLLGVTAGVALVVGSVYALRPPQRDTEFYVLGARGELRDYPRDLQPGQAYTLRVGVHNQDGVPRRFEVRAGAARLALPELASGGRWEGQLALRAPSQPGRLALPIVLRQSGQTAPYRTLSLTLQVGGPPPAALSQEGAVLPGGQP